MTPKLVTPGRSTRHRDMRATEANVSEPSPVVTFVKVLFGGVVALPIAYMIVMWVFSQDPLGIGKQLGSKIPFVVPSALRAKAEESSDSTNEESADPPDFDDSNSFEPSSVDPDFDTLKIGEEALRGFDG